MISRLFVAALTLAVLAGCTTYNGGYRHYAPAQAGYGDYYYDPAPAPRYYAAPAYVHYPAYYSLYWGFDRHYYSPWHRPHFHYGVTWFPNDWFAFSVVHRYPYRYWHPYAPYRYSAWDHRFAWYHYTSPRHRHHYREPRFGHPANERHIQREHVAAARDAHRQQRFDGERAQRRFTRNEPAFQGNRTAPAGMRPHARGALDSAVQPQRASVSQLRHPAPDAAAIQPRARSAMREPTHAPARIGDAPQARLRANEMQPRARDQQPWSSSGTAPTRRELSDRDGRLTAPARQQARQLPAPATVPAPRARVPAQDVRQAPAPMQPRARTPRAPDAQAPATRAAAPRMQAGQTDRPHLAPAPRSVAPNRAAASPAQPAPMPRQMPRQVPRAASTPAPVARSAAPTPAAAPAAARQAAPAPARAQAPARRSEARTRRSSDQEY